MSLDRTLHSLRSRFLYSFADWVYDAVHGEPEKGGGFDDDECFADLAQDTAKIARPHKDTILHDFIGMVCKLYIESATWEEPSYAIDYFCDLFEAASMRRPRWLTKGQVDDNRSALHKRACQAIDIFTPSIFFILYSDRQFLRDFQARLSEHVARGRRADHPNEFARDGVLRRVPLPIWLKRGVYYRDGGRCSHCQKDLTGWNRAVADIHLDHIIPLALSGSNDPTNYQLLCTECNLHKGPTRFHVPPVFAAYW